MEKELPLPLEETRHREQEMQDKGAQENSHTPLCPGIKKKETYAYNHISNQIRGELLQRVLFKREKLADVARGLKINYSSAKSILRIYRKYGRVEKIPHKMRKMTQKLYKEPLVERNARATLSNISIPAINRPKAAEPSNIKQELEEKTNKTVDMSYLEKSLQQDTFAEFGRTNSAAGALDLSKLIQLQRERELLNQTAAIQNRIQLISALLNTNNQTTLHYPNVMFPAAYPVLPNSMLGQNSMIFQSRSVYPSSILGLPRFDS